jgi:hypothetical protein
MALTEGKLPITVKEKSAKTGDYSSATLRQVADVHDTFKKHRGSITDGKAEKAGLKDRAVMQGLGVMETALGTQTKRGYMYNFNDSKKYAKDKKAAMIVGKDVADSHSIKKATEGVAQPSDIYKYTAKSFYGGAKDYAKKKHQQATEIAAGMHIAQKKMRLPSVKTLEEGLQKWRGPYEKGYIPAIKSIAEQVQ